MLASALNENPGPADFRFRFRFRFLFLFLFLKKTASCQAAGAEFLQRLGERTTDHDTPRASRPVTRR